MTGDLTRYMRKFNNVPSERPDWFYFGATTLLTLAAGYLAIRCGQTWIKYFGL